MIALVIFYDFYFNPLWNFFSELQRQKYNVKFIGF